MWRTPRPVPSSAASRRLQSFGSRSLASHDAAAALREPSQFSETGRTVAGAQPICGSQNIARHTARSNGFWSALSISLLSLPSHGHLVVESRRRATCQVESVGAVESSFHRSVDPHGHCRPVVRSRGVTVGVRALTLSGQPRFVTSAGA